MDYDKVIVFYAYGWSAIPVTPKSRFHLNQLRVFGFQLFQWKIGKTLSLCKTIFLLVI